MRLSYTYELADMYNFVFGRLPLFHGRTMS